MTTSVLYPIQGQTTRTNNLLPIDLASFHGQEVRRVSLTGTSLTKSPTKLPTVHPSNQCASSPATPNRPRIREQQGKDVAYIESLKDGAKFQAHLKGVTGRDDVIVKEVRFQSEWRYVLENVFLEKQWLLSVFLV